MFIAIAATAPTVSAVTKPTPRTVSGLPSTASRAVTDGCRASSRRHPSAAPVLGGAGRDLSGVQQVPKRLGRVQPPGRLAVGGDHEGAAAPAATSMVAATNTTAWTRYACGTSVSPASRISGSDASATTGIVIQAIPAPRTPG